MFRKPGKLHGDKAYDQTELRRWVRDQGFTGRIACTGSEPRDTLLALSVVRMCLTPQSREALGWESPAERFAWATVAFGEADIEVVVTAVARGIGSTSSAAPRAATALGWASTASRHARTSCSQRSGLVQARHDASEHDEHAEWERPTPGQWYWHETDGGRRTVQITRIDVGANGMGPEATSERQTALSLAAPVSGDSCLRHR